MTAGPVFGPRTALLVVDVQNDFAHPDGSLFVAAAPRTFAEVNAAVVAASDAGALVVRTQDWHPPTTPHFAKDGGIWPVHCVAESWGAAFHGDLAATGPVIRKGVAGEDGYSGFTARDPVSGDAASTGLHELLTERNVTDVVVCGLATDYCVKETVLDAIRLGYRATVLADGIGAVDLAPGDGARAIAAIVAAGASVV